MYIPAIRTCVTNNPLHSFVPHLKGITIAGNFLNSAESFLASILLLKALPFLPLSFLLRHTHSQMLPF